MLFRSVSQSRYIMFPSHDTDQEVSKMTVSMLDVARWEQDVDCLFGLVQPKITIAKKEACVCCGKDVYAHKMCKACYMNFEG